MTSGRNSSIVRLSLPNAQNNPSIRPKANDSTLIPLLSNLCFSESLDSPERVTIFAVSRSGSRFETMLKSWLVGPQRFKVETMYKILTFSIYQKLLILTKDTVKIKTPNRVCQNRRGPICIKRYVNTIRKFKWIISVNEKTIYTLLDDVIRATRTIH